jgi:ADP-dependent NAD(P)H-hydrate dehydratase / NAD(P)H-hydrate epimerase
MEILTAAEMAEADRRTAEQFAIALWQLMENAGAAVARFCLRRYPQVTRVAVLCGKGNNGGDGLVAARVLAEAGLHVTVILLGATSELRGEAATAFERLRSSTEPIKILNLVEAPGDEAFANDYAEAWKGAQLFIDAVVGTGFKPPLRGLAQALRDRLAETDTPIVAVDLPSGWDADSTEQDAPGPFRADAVVTFTRPKSAHIFGHMTRATLGPVVVAEIGSPPEAVTSATGLHWAGSAKAIAEAPREVNANKGKYGHVLVVGGSYGTAGAPAMASLAALRTGAGLVTAAVPARILDLVAAIAPELMLAPLAEGTEGSVSLANLDAGGLNAVIEAKRISVLALGPGLSTKGDASEFARRLVAKSKLPIVIDADALNAFAGKAELLDGSGRTMVLTPHPGEMARLTGLTIKEVEADRIGLARRFATEHHLTLVLKGWRTLIAHPDGSIAVNTTGNPAMAKGGSGDILTGIVAAMLAQFPNDVARAVEAAVYLHGLAGDFAVRAMDEHTVLATDTVTHLSDAFRYRVRDADGLTWICGLNASSRGRYPWWKHRAARRERGEQ